MPVCSLSDAKETPSECKEPFSGFKEASIELKEPFSGCKEASVELKEPFSGFKEPFSECKEASVELKEPFSGFKEPSSGCKQPLSDFKQPSSGFKQPWSDFTRRGRAARNTPAQNRRCWVQPAHAQVASSRGSLNVGRFFFRVRADTGQVFDLYYDRALKNIDERKGQWFVYRELSLY